MDLSEKERAIGVPPGARRAAASIRIVVREWHAARNRLPEFDVPSSTDQNLSVKVLLSGLNAFRIVVISDGSASSR